MPRDVDELIALLRSIQGQGAGVIAEPIREIIQRLEICHGCAYCGRVVRDLHATQMEDPGHCLNCGARLAGFAHRPVLPGTCELEHLEVDDLVPMNEGPYYHCNKCPEKFETSNQLVGHHVVKHGLQPSNPDPSNPEPMQ